MFQIISYIKFLFKSTNQHGVHSPFVYDLVTKCFYVNTKYEDYSKIALYRKALLENNNQIEITDYGSGSRVFNSNLRTISAIAKTSGSTYKRAKLLYRLVNYFKPNQILELGTSLGIATQAMALGNTKSKLITLEGCPNSSAIASEQLNNCNIGNVTHKIGAFESSLEQLNHNIYDLIFIDGNHNKNATLNYFETLLNKVHNDSLIIFDDIHWSKDMYEAWTMIQSHPKVTVTIDTFFWGFVFFRKEQAKENFNIRL